MIIATDAAMGAVPVFSEKLFDLLSKNCDAHELRHVQANQPLDDADIFFGQPSVKQIVTAEKIRWFQLTSAGYTRFDTASFRTLARERAIKLTNSSNVYDQPCAQHIMAFMLAHTRVLPEAFMHQQNCDWQRDALRSKSTLLTGQKVFIAGYGAIARELMRLLAPFNMQYVAMCRHPEKYNSADAVRMIDTAHSDQWISWADHVVNTLPANEESENFFNADRLAKIQPHAAFYNIGRGTTVDQNALIYQLNEGKLAGAYLDVTDPEPLPSEHPLWRTPRCVITSHYGGGFTDEWHALGQHFIANLERYLRNEPLQNQVI